MYASKLVCNNYNWTTVSGLAQKGIFVYRGKNISYYFGLEEWLNNAFLRKMKVGYIDSYRAHLRHGFAERIALFTYCKSNRQVYYVGDIYDVCQVADEEIEDLRNILIGQNWLQEVERGFHNIGDNRANGNHTDYMQCWNSNLIIAQTGQAFILNIRYEKFELLPQRDWVNLSELNGEINNRWRRLVHRYIVPDEYEEYFI